MVHSSPLEISLHFFCKGISDRRLAKHEILNRLGELVQCNKTTSNFSRTLRRAQQMGRYPHRFWRNCRHLARRIPWAAGGYQILSHAHHPNVERGKGGAYTVGMGGLLSNGIPRSYGNGCPRGGSYPTQISYRFLAWT